MSRERPTGAPYILGTLSAQKALVRELSPKQQRSTTPSPPPSEKLTKPAWNDSGLLLSAQNDKRLASKRSYFSSTLDLSRGERDEKLFPSSPGRKVRSPGRRDNQGSDTKQVNP